MNGKVIEIGRRGVALALALSVCLLLPSTVRADSPARDHTEQDAGAVGEVLLGPQEEPTQPWTHHTISFADEITGQTIIITMDENNRAVGTLIETEGTTSVVPPYEVDADVVLVEESDALSLFEILSAGDYAGEALFEPYASGIGRLTILDADGEVLCTGLLKGHALHIPITASGGGAGARRRGDDPWLKEVLDAVVAIVSDILDGIGDPALCSKSMKRHCRQATPPCTGCKKTVLEGGGTHEECTGC